MRRVRSFAILGLTLAAALRAQTAPDAAELTTLLNEFLNGASRNDAAMHDRFWAEDPIYTGSAGRRVGKAEILRDVRSAALSKSGDPTTVYSAEDIRIQQYGDTAVVAFRLVGTTKKGGAAETTNYLNTGTFVTRNGAWRAVSWQATRMPRQEEEVLPRVDHLVYGARDMELAIATLEKLLGVRATPGGQHPGRGTRNSLIALGPKAYLEILAPDPAQRKPDQPRAFGLDDLKAPRLVAWAAKGMKLEQIVDKAQRKNVKLGEARSGSRRRPDGVLLTWRFTDPSAILADGIVPFFIDWGATSHPAETAAPGVSLIGLRAEHPAPEPVRAMLTALEIDLPLKSGPVPALIATIRTSRGVVELR